MKLFEIKNNLVEFTDLITNPETELDQQTIDDTFEALSGEFEEKGLNVARVFQNIEAEAKAIKEAESRMAARRKAMENAVDRLKAYLQTNMEEAGITKIECPEFSVSLQQSPESVVIVNEGLLPDEFFEIKKVVSKSKVKEFIKEHGPLDGAELVRNKHIRIR